MRIPLLALLFSGFVSSIQLPLGAQGTPPATEAAVEAKQVEVANVKFGNARFSGSDWLETEVELDVKPGGRSVSGEFVDRVRVTLSIMVECNSTREGAKTSFYRSSVEAITLEGGKPMIRFYLPPEVVTRDGLRPTVKFYVVDIEVDGEPQSLGRGAFSRDLTSLESVKNFQSRVNSDGSVNEGILMPQYLTPFANDPRRPSPTLLRRENLR